MSTSLIVALVALTVSITTWAHSAHPVLEAHGVCGKVSALRCRLHETAQKATHPMKTLRGN